MEEITIREVDLKERDLMFQIFTLRVTCRQEMGIITREKYPFGWMDEMDVYSRHFAAFHEENIIAAGRLTIFDNISFHPYYPIIEHIVPPSLQNKPIAHLSKDQVYPSYRGNGLRKDLLLTREMICREHHIEDLVIDIDVSRNQHTNFCRNGYTDLGQFSIDKIHWGVGSGLLMHKTLR